MTILANKNAVKRRHAAAEVLLRQGVSAPSSGGRTVNWVNVNVSAGGYYHEIKNFTISGGCVTFNKMQNDTVAIHKGYNGCLAGTYSFSLNYISGGLLEKTRGRVCSGRFNVSGRKHNVLISMVSDCSAIIREF